MSLFAQFPIEKLPCRENIHNRTRTRSNIPVVSIVWIVLILLVDRIVAWPVVPIVGPVQALQPHHYLITITSHIPWMKPTRAEGRERLAREGLIYGRRGRNIWKQVAHRRMWCMILLRTSQWARAVTFLTPKQVAELLNVAVTTVYSMCDKNVLEHHRFGVGRGTIRVSQQQLDDFIRRSRVGQRDLAVETSEPPYTDYVFGTRARRPRRSSKPAADDATSAEAEGKKRRRKK